jgi:hypothetical protein
MWWKNWGKKYYKYIIYHNINRMASLSKELKCLICNKKFLTKKGLEIHETEQTCINKVDSYICMICGLDCKGSSEPNL